MEEPIWTDADRETYRDQGDRYPSDLTDVQWATVAPLLLGYDPLTADLGEMVNALPVPGEDRLPVALPGP